jgi:hypothetical protein
MSLGGIVRRKVIASRGKSIVGVASLSPSAWELLNFKSTNGGKFDEADSLGGHE